MLRRDSVRAIRPGLGLPPKYLDIVLGIAVKRNACVGVPFAWNVLG